jgi:predicted membrane channel-forming protein YqfA (hemolysin III family)
MELLLPGFGLLFWTLLVPFFIVLPLLALVSLLRATFNDSTTKLIWLIVILLVPVAGSLFYFFIGRRQRIPTT